MTAKTCRPCQLNCVNQVDFLELLQRYGNARLQVAIHLRHRVPTGAPTVPLFNETISRTAHRPPDDGLVARPSFGGHRSNDQCGRGPDAGRNRQDHCHVTRDSYPCSRQSSLAEYWRDSRFDPVDPRHGSLSRVGQLAERAPCPSLQAGVAVLGNSTPHRHVV